MQTIEIDTEVYTFLQKQAIPFTDDPNSVLRRLLLDPKHGSETPESKSTAVRSNRIAVRTGDRDNAGNEAYVQKTLGQKFIGKFRRVPGYRMMFESQSDIVYFHNFSKLNGENLWYRLNATPLATMRSKKKSKWICFTNPADNYGFLVPLEDIDRRVKASGWDRDDREVNIHVSEGLWRELGWRLDEYHFTLNAN